jgi:hypothetical protein
MDLSARILDLVRSSADNAVKGSSVIDISRELYTWIIRERIPESAFNYCAELVVGVTHPNEYGLQLRDNLAKPTSKTTRFGGLNINLAGSVGRLMSFDIDYCYMVTTVAVVMEFHDMTFATNVPCNMALDKGAHDEIVDYPYDIRRTRIKPVITKIVDSIALNVVNSGHRLQSLPDELQDLCIHVADPETFAAVIMTVQRVRENIVLLSDVLYGDIVAWLIAHFMGILEISIAGKRTFEKRCGSEEVRATMVVVQRCSTTVDNHPNIGERSFLELSTNTSGVEKTVLRAIPSCFSGSTPTARMALYDTSNISKRRPKSSFRNEELDAPLTTSEISDIQLNAQAVLGWLLHLHINEPDRRRHSMGFSIGPSSNQGSAPNIGSLLSNWPGLLHKNFGGPLRSMVIFIPPTETSREKHTDWGEQGSKVAWTVILECFPTIKTLLENIRPRCRCNSCQNETLVDYSYRQPGCLQATALTILVTLLSHAITDGFGAVDVSGISQAKIEIQSLAMQKVLSELIFDKRVVWKTWFSVASFNVLGSLLGDSIETPDSRLVEGASEPVAAQYGSLVIVAKWVDLTVEQHLQGCFGFHCTEGSLVGVGDEYAVVYSEKSMRPPDAGQYSAWDFTSCDYESSPGDPNDITDAWQAKSNMRKTSMANICVNTAIIGAGSPYRLLTMIKSDSYLRIVDPSDILAALSNSETSQSGHDGSHRVGAFLDRKYISFWAFDELLGAWDISNRTFDRNTQAVVPLDKGNIEKGAAKIGSLPMHYVTTRLETYLELNVAMALSPFNGCLIKRTGDCLPCAITRLKHRQASEPESSSPRILVCDKGTRELERIREY